MELLLVLVDSDRPGLSTAHLQLTVEWPPVSNWVPQPWLQAFRMGPMNLRVDWQYHTLRCCFCHGLSSSEWFVNDAAWLLADGPLAQHLFNHANWTKAGQMGALLHFCEHCVDTLELNWSVQLEEAPRSPRLRMQLELVRPAGSLREVHDGSDWLSLNLRSLPPQWRRDINESPNHFMRISGPWQP
jgi:hypothetical protein